MLEQYGMLYNWYAVNDARGLAPDGWRVATDEDWERLSDLYKGESIAAGYRGPSSFNGIENFGYWWSLNENTSHSAWMRFINISFNKVASTNYDTNYGFSVRCIKK